MILFFDTETTGLANWKQPDNHPSQPRLVQLGAILTEDDGSVVRTIGVIVKPEGFVIPTEASDVHGITTEVALKHGIAQFDAITLMAQMVNRADKVVAHNYKFDKVVINREFIEEEYQYLNDSKAFCTMEATTDICRLPHTSKWFPGKSKYKWPKLEEAYFALFGEALVGAHDALNDVRATMRVYFELKRLERVKKEFSNRPTVVC